MPSLIHEKYFLKNMILELINFRCLHIYSTLLNKQILAFIINDLCTEQFLMFDVDFNHI